MASPTHSSHEADEELLLGGDITAADAMPVRQASSRAVVALTTVGLIGAAGLVALLRHSGPQAGEPTLTMEKFEVEKSSLQQHVADVSIPSAATTSDASLSPSMPKPTTPPKKRKQLRIEGDLGSLLTEHNIGKGATQAPPTTSECGIHAKGLFDSVMMHAGLDKELDVDEKGAFGDRFTGEMDRACQRDPLFITREDGWLEGAKDALEQQKPVMTKALAHNLNRAGYGWQAKMQDWMVHESKASFEARLGRTALPHDANATEAQDSGHGRQGSLLPESFNSATRWARCQKEILRVHNQGICGSCWAFSCSQVLNARICIESDDESKFDGDDAQVAPGYFSSCAANRAHPGDGCGGGWEYFCYQYIDRPGTPGAVSETCSPYFGVGSGINHFKQSSHAPACPTTCREGYPRTLAQDGFKLPGVSGYRLLMPANHHAHHLAKQAIYHGGPINHGIYASGHFMGYSGGVYDHCTGMSANHAVVTYGWFEGGYLSKNSWGEDWGESGLMRLADCIMTDFTIPGHFDGWSSHIPYPLADLVV